MNLLAYAEPQFRDAGDSGVIIEFGDVLDEAINNAVIAFASALEHANLQGVIETLPTIRSVMVKYDPLVVSDQKIRGQLSELLATRNWLQAAPPPGRIRWHIPVTYGGIHGPDLVEISETMDVSQDEAIAAHINACQRVFMIGFAPGQAYLGQLPGMWDIPRRVSIIPDVPAGSVLVAVRQTVLYATPNPTGWHLIGCSPFRGFRPQSDPPFLLSAGDEVIFEQIGETEYSALEALELRGECCARREVIS